MQMFCKWLIISVLCIKIKKAWVFFVADRGFGETLTTIQSKTHAERRHYNLDPRS